MSKSNLDTWETLSFGRIFERGVWVQGNNGFGNSRLGQQGQVHRVRARVMWLFLKSWARKHFHNSRSCSRSRNRQTCRFLNQTAWI